MRHRTCIDRYLASRNGDVKKLKPPLTGFRLLCGDFRVFFDLRDENFIEITGVRNRKETIADSGVGDVSPLQPMRSIVLRPLSFRYPSG